MAEKKGEAKRKMTGIKEPMNKSLILKEIAENTGLNKKQVASVLDELAIVIERHIKNRAAGQFTLPGLLKFEVRKRPAIKAHRGINPFTKEEMDIPAKPARRVVKVRALKKVQDMAQ